MHIIYFLTGLAFFFGLGVVGAAAWAPFRIKKIRRRFRARRYQGIANALDMEYWDERQQPPYPFPVFDLGSITVLIRGQANGADVYVGELGLQRSGMVITDNICLIEDASLDLPAFLIERPFPHNWVNTRLLIPYYQEYGNPTRYPCLHPDEVVWFRDDMEFMSLCRVLCEEHRAGLRLFNREVRDFLWNKPGFSAIAGCGHVIFVSFYASISAHSLVSFTQFALKLHALLKKGV